MKKLYTLKSKPAYEAVKKTFNGKNHFVLPITLLVEGVHHAGNADVPYYYPGEALTFLPEVWSDTCVLINHPKEITANIVEVHEREVLGRLFETKYDSGLKAELWLDEEKLKEKDPELHARIEKGEEIEVSTGVFLELQEEKGTWNGEEYGAKVLRMWPDHLALLPADKGACSIDDGCGIRNEAAEKADDSLAKRIIEGIKGLISSKEDCKCKNHDTEAIKMDKEKVIAALIANKHYTEEDRKTLEAFDDKHISELAKLCEEKPATEEPEKEDPVTTEPAAEAGREEEDPKPQTEEEYINSAPEGIREVLKEGLNMRKAKKASLVKAIKDNPANKFTEEALNAKSIEELENIASLAHVEVDYSLNGSGAAPVDNDKVDPPPPLFMVSKAANE